MKKSKYFLIGFLIISFMVGYSQNLYSPFENIELEYYLNPFLSSYGSSQIEYNKEPTLSFQPGSKREYSFYLSDDPDFKEEKGIPEEVEEIIEERGRNYKVFKLSSGERRMIVYGIPIHHEPEGPGTGNWDEIDSNLKKTSSGWEMVRNDWYVFFDKDYSSIWPVTLSRKGGFSLRYKDIGLGYLSPEREYIELENFKNSKSKLTGKKGVRNSLEYSNVFSGVDIRYKLDNHYLKKDIIISREAKKDFLKKIDNNLFDKEGYLVVSTKLDLSKLNGWELDIENGEEIEGSLFIKAPVNWPYESMDRLAEGKVYDEIGNKQKIRYRLVKNPQNGFILLTMVPISWLKESLGEVVIDPTYYSSLSDGYVYVSGFDWSDTRSGLNLLMEGSSDSDANREDSIRAVYDSSASSYYISRSFFYFDTSGLPDDCTVTNALLKVYGYNYYQSDVSAQQGTQSETLSSNDFNAFSGNLYCVFEETSGDGDGKWNTYKYNTCNLDGSTDVPSGELADDGRDYISKTGVTKICLREYSHDYSNFQPTAWHHNGCYFADEPGTSTDPYLDITYTVPTTTTTTLTPEECPSLTLTPSEGPPSYTVTADVAYDTCKICDSQGCDPQDSANCAGNLIRTGDGTFTAPSSTGTYDYYSCPGEGYDTITVTETTTTTTTTTSSTTTTTTSSTTTTTTSSTTTTTTSSTTTTTILTTTSTISTTTTTLIPSYNFNTWSERQGIFTIGESSPFLIYVENTGNTEDNYTITYDVDYENPPGNDLSHLIDVHLASNRIEDLDEDQIRDTQGSIKLLGQVFNPPGATITFTVEADSGGQKQTSIDISGGASGGTPKTLPEFGLIGFLELFLIVVGLVLFSLR